MELSHKSQIFSNLAVSNASESQHTTFKHGAVLVKNGKIIGQGSNTSRTRYGGQNHPSMHAEVAALRSLKGKCLLWG